MKKLIMYMGADDPEAEEAEKVAKANGIVVGYAMKEGRRVTSGTAYSADSVTIPHRHDESVVLFECNLPVTAREIIRLDHHRVGDPGYNSTPTDYMQGSSLGQLLLLLGLEPTKEQRIIAAADHCLAAAYQGLCPGITPEEVSDFRAASKAKFHGTTKDVLIKKIRNATATLLAAKEMDDLPGVKNLLHERVEELAEAAVKLGLAYCTRVHDATGREKITIGGNASPETISMFMGDFARRHHLVDVYGVPTRGYAGGYCQ